MGCFCRNLIPTPLVNLSADLTPDLHLPPTDPLLTAVSSHLSARWLPAAPWVPDPAWLQIELPKLQMPSASLSVLTSLVVAMQACKVSLGLDIGDPRQAAQLARIVATLNARLALLQELELDARPWLTLLQLNAQSDMIHSAVGMNLLVAPPPIDMRFDVRLDPWKALLLRMKALAPLIAIGQTMGLNWGDPEAPGVLASRVRLLARITLPPLLDAALVMRLIARLDAVARLKLSLGGDPSGHSFARVRLAVEARAKAALSLLPPGIHLADGILVGMPDLLPNPSLILNDGMMKHASRLDARVIARLNWQVPAFEQLALLTVALPVAQLASAMAQVGVDPIRLSPCGPACDAAKVMRELAA